MIHIEVDPTLSVEALDVVWKSAWGTSASDYIQQVLPRSLAYLGAFDDRNLIGFVNIAWDGGQHAFILDTAVHADFRRRGIATQLLNEAVEVARARGAEWLHVDFEPHLEPFYRACGFRATSAGLIHLNS